MIINNNVQSKNTILIEIPLNYTITKIQREIGKLLNKKINKKLSKFNKDNPSEITTRLRYIITSVNGNSDLGHITNFIKNQFTDLI